jgi:hypothetical protein
MRLYLPIPNGGLLSCALHFSAISQISTRCNVRLTSGEKPLIPATVGPGHNRHWCRTGVCHDTAQRDINEWARSLARRAAGNDPRRWPFASHDRSVADAGLMLACMQRRVRMRLRMARNS